MVCDSFHLQQLAYFAVCVCVCSGAVKLDRAPPTSNNQPKAKLCRSVLLLACTLVTVLWLSVITAV